MPRKPRFDALSPIVLRVSAIVEYGLYRYFVISRPDAIFCLKFDRLIVMAGGIWTYELYLI